MKKEATVLILYASYGAGHIQVAQALKQEFERRGTHRAVLVDLFHESHPFVDAATRVFYRNSFTKYPWLYGWIYYRTQHLEHEGPLFQISNSFGLRRLKEIIKEEQPEMVINTFPMLAMSEFRRKTGQRIPTYSVLTDFVIHNNWLHKEIDAYFVATDDLAAQLRQRGIPADAVRATGIPIRLPFQRAEDAEAEKQQIQRQNGFDLQKKTVLMSAGGYGVAWKWPELIEKFCANNWQVLVVCGKNEKVREQLTNEFRDHADVHVFGYTNKMHELMKSADLLVTKPGGITIAEAISLELPLFLMAPVPGQERENARYLEAKGAACVIWGEEDLGKVEAFLENPLQLRDMRTGVAGLKKVNSAERMVSAILSQAHVREGQFSRVPDWTVVAQ